MITLVLGGSRSGKSTVAERIAAKRPGPVTYVATATPDPADADFAIRIAAHRNRRPATWATVESGPDLATAISGLTGSLLIDSLGMWVAAHHDFVVDVDALVAALTERDGDIVIVSDEVGMGVHPSTDTGRRYRDALGTVNQAVADVADDVLLIVAGRVLPLGRGEC